MSYSLNEIETLAKRAARGAGLDWGLAEEAGKTLRWLVQRNLPGPALLAKLLTRHDGRSYAELAPASDGTPWQAPGGCLSPLLAGPALCDRAEDLAAGRRFELGETAFPLLLAPGLAAAAKTKDMALTLAWAGLEIVITAPGPTHADFAVAGGRERLAAETAPAVTIIAREAPETADGPQRFAGRADLDATVRGCLEAFARRTYAPASEASRLAGAGAGLSDND